MSVSPIVLLVMLGMFFAAPAQADSRPVSVGPYAQVKMGAEDFVGRNKRHVSLGPTFGLHLGTDVFQWLSVGGRVKIANHQATVPAPPNGEYMQMYELAGEARLSLSLGPVAIFVEGGLGISAMSTNIMEKVMLIDPGQRYSPFVHAGGGLEYQLQNRHYGFGIGGTWSAYSSFTKLQVVSGHLHFRYTY